MKKNEIYEGMVTELKFPNKGKVMVENEEETVMVKNTLPGQKVRFRLAKNKKIKKKESFLKCWNFRILRHRHRLVRILNFAVDVRIRPCLMRDSAT